MRCLADGGERSRARCELPGTRSQRLSPDRVVALGVGRKFQTANIFETLSVADCLRIARARSEWPSLIEASAVLALPAASRAVMESAGPHRAAWARRRGYLATA